MPTPEEWSEAGIIADESLGHPSKCTPEAGIAEMKRRIGLLEQKRERMKGFTGPSETIITELKTVYSELQEARERLAEYEHQLEGRN